MFNICYKQELANYVLWVKPKLCLFLYGPGTKNDFYIFKCQKDHKPFHENSCSRVEDIATWPTTLKIFTICLCRKRLPTPIVNSTKYSENIITFNLCSTPRM